MNTTYKTSKVILTAAVVGALFAGCERRADTAEQSSPANSPATPSATAPAPDTGAGSGVVTATGSAGTNSDATMTSPGTTAGSAATTAGNNVEAGAEKAGDKLESGADKAGATMGAATDKTGEKLDAATDKAGEKASEAKQAAGNVIDESVITGKVKAALLADERVKGLDISVETKDSEVMLSGFVESQAQIDNAVKIAQNIDGVAKVTNKLTVKK